MWFQSNILVIKTSNIALFWFPYMHWQQLNALFARFITKRICTVVKMLFKSIFTSIIIMFISSCVCVRVSVCVCVYTPPLWDFVCNVILDILECIDQRSCVVGIILDASTKFHHLSFGIYHISTSKTIFRCNRNNTIWHMTPQRCYIVFDKVPSSTDM